MRTIKSKWAQDAILELAALVEIRRVNERKEKDLRDMFKDEMGDDELMRVGEFILIASTRIRTDLDKKALQQRLGDELKEFEKKTEYKTLDVKTV
jgi:predicted phage-related endonuclease